MRNVNVIGVGMTPFTTPKAKIPYTKMGPQAGSDALKDAGVDYKEIEHAYTGWVYGDSCAGERVVYELGLTGIPIFNLNNNCSTGSNALFLARMAVGSGTVECALALGFEQMTPGALGSVFSDRPNPMEKYIVTLLKMQKFTSAPPAAQMFGGAGEEYQEKYGTKPETFAKISVKARKHAEHNERAVFRNLLLRRRRRGSLLRRLRQEAQRHKPRLHHRAVDGHRFREFIRRQPDERGRLRHDRGRGQGGL